MQILKITTKQMKNHFFHLCLTQVLKLFTSTPLKCPDVAWMKKLYSYV